MTEYKYRENINDKDGNTIGCKEIIIPNAIVKQIRADVIDECVEILRESYPIIDNEDILYGFSCAIHRMEQLKENK